MSVPITPNMSLLQPVTGVTAGSTANDDYNANWTTLDQHDHSPGKGAPITPSAFNINSDLPFNGNNATTLRSARFSVQTSALAGASDLACLYFSGVDLWANDASGNQIRITAGGSVNATTSGISSGTASASFVSSVLVVNAASNKPANVQCASFLLGNNITGSKYLTLSPPNAMAADYSLVLPALPSVTSILTLDTSGNISAAYTVDNSTIEINGSSQIAVKSAGIGTTQLVDQSVTAAKITDATITGTQITSSINLPGNAAQENGMNLVVSAANASTSVKILWGSVASNGTILQGTGFTVSHGVTGGYTLTFTASFASTPAVLVTLGGGVPGMCGTSAASTSSTSVVTYNSSGIAANEAFSFIVIGPR